MDPLKPETPQTPEPEVTADTLVSDRNYLNPIKGYLNAGDDAKTAQQLDYIYQEITKDKNLNEGDVLAAVREIRLRIGTPLLGETMVSKIFNYLKAEAAVRNAKKLRDAHLL